MRSRALLKVAAVLTVNVAVIATCLIAAAQPSYANTLYVTAVKNAGAVNADGLKATLQNNGLFFEWSATSAMLNNQGKVVPTNPKAAPNQFMNTSKKGVSTFTEKLKNALTPANYILFYSVRNNQSLDTTNNASTLLSGANNVGTRFGNAAKSKAGDPEVDVTNTTGSTMVLTSVTALLNNSQDPLNLSTVFVPDGTPVPVVPTFTPGETLPDGQALAFTFSDAGASNWSFEITYTVGSDVYDEIVAQDVTPEPGSIVLLATGVGAFGLLCASRRKRLISAGAPDLR
jgi:hypothetical protein